MDTLQFKTPFGAVAIELDSEHAPETCRYFSAYALGGGYNDGVIFRTTSQVVSESPYEASIQVIQMGTELGLAAKREIIAHESTKQTGKIHQQWCVSAARFAPGQVYGSFFVCLRDEPSLDYGGQRQPDGLGYAVFGHVVTGRQALLDAYAAAPRSEGELLRHPVPFRYLPTTD